MIQILETLFNTIVHGIENLIEIITFIPTYIYGYMQNFMDVLGGNAIWIIGLAMSVAIVIKIKRLVF